jgi:hypothetical protein
MLSVAETVSSQREVNDGCGIIGTLRSKHGVVSEITDVAKPALLFPSAGLVCVCVCVCVCGFRRCSHRFLFGINLATQSLETMVYSPEVDVLPGTLPATETAS